MPRWQIEMKINPANPGKNLDLPPSFFQPNQPSKALYLYCLRIVNTGFKFG